MSKISLFKVVRHCLASIALLCVVLPSSAHSVKDPLGTAVAESTSARVIPITASTKTVNVQRHETVRFVNPAGQSLTWHFYTLNHPTIDLRDIAPAGRRWRLMASR